MYSPENKTYTKLLFSTLKSCDSLTFFLKNNKSVIIIDNYYESHSENALISSIFFQLHGEINS